MDSTSELQTTPETEISLDFPESSTRKMYASSKQLKIIIDIYEKMNLPISITMDLSLCDEEKYRVLVCYRNFHTLLVDWLFEEVLRREAGITY